MAQVKKVSKKEMEARRKARNAYSLEWKKAHAKKVAKWNRDWYLRQVSAERKAA